MKTLRVLFLVGLFPSIGFCEGTRFHHKDTFINQEFENVYQKADKLDSRISNIFFNVEDYGARGDGSDDRMAIQGAIQAAESAGGGRVRFGVKKYSIGNTIFVPTGVTLEGVVAVSTIAALSGTFPADRHLIQISHTNGTIYTQSDPGKGISIKNLILDCSGMPTAVSLGTGMGIYVPDMSYFTAEGLTIVSSQGYGIGMEGTAGTYSIQNPSISYCTLRDCGRNGGQDSIGGGHNIGSIYAYNTFDAPNGNAIDNVNVKQAHWTHNRSINTSTTTHSGSIWCDYGMIDSIVDYNLITNGSIHIYGFLTSIYQGAPSNVTIQGNQLRNAGTGAILISPANQVSTDTKVAANIQVKDNVIDGAYDYGILLTDVFAASVQGNTINNWSLTAGGPYAAIFFAAGPNTTVLSSACVISGNNGMHGANSTGYYAEVANVTLNNSIYGNSFPGCDSGVLGSTAALPTSTLLEISHSDVYTSSMTDFTAISVVNGWSAFSTKIIKYKKTGKTITVVWNLVGTSSSTVINFNLPYAAASNVPYFLTSCYVADNGVAPTNPGQASITSASTTISIFKDNAGTAFTNSGSKSTFGELIYETN